MSSIVVYLIRLIEKTLHTSPTAMFFHVSLDSPVMVVYSAVPEGLLIYSDLREHIKNNILYTGQSQDGTLWDNGGVITVVLMFRRR